MVPLAEAQEMILHSVRPLARRSIALDEALGCVSAAAVTATEPVPPFANTAMDGFAVRSVDTAAVPTRLEVVGVLPAGADPFGLRVDPGQAIRIMTGAPIPDGADAVVMVERTSGGENAGDTVVVDVAVAPGNHIRAAGEDLAPGDEVFPAGTVLGPAHLGVLASLGLETVQVHPRAQVGVMSTGDELVDGPARLRPGQIRDSNRHALLALVRQAGATPVDLGRVPDDEEAIGDALLRGSERCDAIVTSGGVSVGDFDYMLLVFERLGDDAHWMQVAIKPAKPLAFAMFDGMPVFGLPGNPASSMVSFELFARPALRRLMGHPDPYRRAVTAVADDDFNRRPDGKLHLVRVVADVAADGRLHARSAGGQGSNLLGSMARANALALVPDGDGVRAGSGLDVLVLS